MIVWGKKYKSETTHILQATACPSHFTWGLKTSFNFFCSQVENMGTTMMNNT
jgi:hypothetical protein